MSSGWSVSSNRPLAKRPKKEVRKKALSYRHDSDVRRSTLQRKRRNRNLETANELKQTLKRLRLSGLLATLPDRVAYAKGTKLSYAEFLELVLNDEIQRRETTNVATRLRSASVDLDQTFERFDWDAAITVDRDRLKDL